jgi:hypothetical protein
MLVACRLAGLFALEAQYVGVNGRAQSSASGCYRSQMAGSGQIFENVPDDQRRQWSCRHGLAIRITRPDRTVHARFSTGRMGCAVERSGRRVTPCVEGAPRPTR